jgi:hypothetical protein
MLAKAGIQESYFWIPAGVYPVEKWGRNDGRMRNDFEVGLKSTFFWNPSPSKRGGIELKIGNMGSVPNFSNF